jgi:pectinesterase
MTIESILLVGDSTVTDEEGWGPGFRARLRPAVECHNRAKGGRSSKSYRDEGWWAAAVAVPADHVLIQFGHNDQPGKGPERETDPETGFAGNLTRYVTEARAAGMRPVLVTSLIRRTFDAESGDLTDTLGPYADATRLVAARLEVPLIDLHVASADLCRLLGPLGCERMSPQKPDGGLDTTHLNAEGARRIGGLVADLARRAVPGLRAVLTGEAAPRC